MTWPMPLQLSKKMRKTQAMKKRSAIADAPAKYNESTSAQCKNAKSHMGQRVPCSNI
jgi:hypothetical protein